MWLLCICIQLGGAQTMIEVFGYRYGDTSVREKDWRCRKRGMHAAYACHGDLAGVTRARQCQPFLRLRTLLFGMLSQQNQHPNPMPRVSNSWWCTAIQSDPIYAALAHFTYLRVQI